MKKLLSLLLTLLMLCMSFCAAAEVYTGVGQGISGDVPVTVTIENGVICSVEVGENAETAGIGTNAIEQLPAKIVETQSIALDSVSGATITSNAILAAVEAALTEAGLDVEAFKAAPEAAELAQGETETTDIVIVGAGMAGLMAAYELQINAP